MNSSEPGDWGAGGAGGVLELSPERFGVVFQLAKELPNMPDSALASEEWTRADANAFLDTLRSRRGDPLSMTSAIEFAASPEELVKWHRMLETVCTALGPEELFLRSGYRAGEIRETLDAWRQSVRARPRSV
ncbi:hypothetical protein [Streptomyces olivochromogenes]|uniref:hypothetical protein n=1 Tax=Streptomyces olivochromogenes TaxID=1963 RepID=UPI001F46346E|nr:hypothetical protein [Streptomyces olivochromogenes]MCF3134936.1 hypothetical protein [Streptomyces olivochromogenes]